MTPIYDNIESELLREQLLATSAESPAEAFVKHLFFKESSTAASKSEELLREQLAASDARATARARRAVKRDARPRRSRDARARPAAIARRDGEIRDRNLRVRDVRDDRATRAIANGSRARAHARRLRAPQASLPPPSPPL